MKMGRFAVTSVLLVALCASISGCGGNQGTTSAAAQHEQIHADKSTKVVAADYQATVQALYIAYFGRPADPMGLANFENALLAANAPTDVVGLGGAYPTNAQVKALVDSFESSAESQALYGNSDITSIVKAIYQNVLGRQPESAGLNFWVTAITSGQLTLGDAALSIMAGGLTNTTAQGLLDAQLINNRLAAASEFTSEIQAPIQYQGAEAASEARNMLTLVTASTDLTAFSTTIAKTRQSTAAIHALPVQKSSYENRMTAAAILGPQPMYGNGYSTAFGDFFQIGQMSMVVNTEEYDPTQPYVAGSANATNFGSIHFYAQVNGQWVDKTSTLLANTVGCLNPRKLLVADFNGDGVPDIFFACHGYDAKPFPGEQPHILLSQPNGTYENITLPITCYCHGASAADVNDNGYADIVVADPTVHGQPYYLENNKDGTFTPDYTRMPPTTAPNTQCNPACNRGIYSAELIKFTNSGNYDLWLGGSNDGTLGSFATSIFYNPGTNSFSSSQATVLPLQGIAVDNNPLDIVYTNGNIYLMRVDQNYTETSIQKIKYSTDMTSSTVYSHQGIYPVIGESWFAWMVPFNGSIEASDSVFAVSIPE